MVKLIVTFEPMKQFRWYKDNSTNHKSVISNGGICRAAPVCRIMYSATHLIVNVGKLN